MKLAVGKGRETNPDLKSVSAVNMAGTRLHRFCHHIGLNYVSCSGPRVPSHAWQRHRQVLEDKYQEPN